MIYQFKKNLFNDIFWHLKSAFENLLVRYIWLYGGSSASKTYTICQLIIIRMLNNTNENTMVVRKYAVDIKDSIYADFKSIIELWGLQDDFILQQNYIECKRTKSYVRFRGLDDSEKIKGLSNFIRIILEEVSQFDEVDLKQIRKRLRGRPGQQIIGIFNPISEEHWIKTNVFDKEVLEEIPTNDMAGMWVNEKGNLVIMKTNYLYNKFIVGPHFVDQHTIDDFEHDKIHDFNYYQIYGLGNWGKIRTGGEFWKKFRTDEHIKNVLWDESQPIHLTFDENVNPYITCLVWQIFTPTYLMQLTAKGYLDAHGEEVYSHKIHQIALGLDGSKTYAIQIDEICLPDPRNRVKYVCDEVILRYPIERVQGMFIYGDRTSIKEDTKMQKGENFFTEIRQYMKDYRPSLRIPNSNPSVVVSANFINACYAGLTPIQIIIGENCKKSIHDYQYALEDSDGTLKKTKKRNPITGVTYEEYGHCFIGETMIKTITGEKRIDQMLVGDMVLTRKGYKKVVKVFNNGVKKVNTYKIGGNTLICTENHKVLFNNKFVSISQIGKGIYCIFDKLNNTICYQRLSFTEVLISQDTQTQKQDQKEFTTQGGLVSIKKGFTGINTNAKLGLLKKDITSITKMITLLIMTLATLSKRLQSNTCKIITMQVAKSLKKILKKYYSKKQYQSLKNGMAQMKDSNGIPNTPDQRSSIMQKLVKHALIAVQNIRLALKNKSIAPKDVTINTKQDVYANVYDIQVEDEHEYFANNVLVHNCSDTKRYFITMAFANEYQTYQRGNKVISPSTGRNLSKNRV